MKKYEIKTLEDFIEAYKKCSSLNDMIFTSEFNKNEIYNYLLEHKNEDIIYCALLGFMHYFGVGVVQSYEEAFKWYELSANQSNKRAQCSLGYMYAEGQGVVQSYEEAFKWYKLSANQGFARAQNNLGSMYAEGQGVAQSYEEAFKWYKLSANQGFARAQYNLGIMYDQGQGVAQSYEEAIKWYKLSADQGFASAQFNLGLMYDKGQGVAQSYEEAFKWYKLSANQGFARAQYNLGIMYDQGQGVAQSYEEAIKWYKLSADQGNLRAQFNLGVMYANGRGVVQSDEEAIKWYKLSADQGFASAQFNLGLMYENGQGVAQSDEEAIKWYKLSANQGNSSAQCNLGVMYANGRGVVQSYEEAIKWYKLSANQGDSSAQYNLALLYMKNDNPEKSYLDAVKYFKLFTNNSIDRDLIKKAYERISNCYLTGGYGLDQNIYLSEFYRYLSQGSNEVAANMLVGFKIYNEEKIKAKPLVRNLEISKQFFNSALELGEDVASRYLDDINLLLTQKDLDNIFLSVEASADAKERTIISQKEIEYKRHEEVNDYVFISWNHKDLKLKEKIYNYLKSEKHLNVWESDRNCQGDRLHNIIHYAISKSSALLRLDTLNSIKSQWVKDEENYAKSLNKNVIIFASEKAEKYRSKKHLEIDSGREIFNKNNIDQSLDLLYIRVREALREENLKIISKNILRYINKFKYSTLSLIGNENNLLNTYVDLNDGFINRRLINLNNNLEEQKTLLENENIAIIADDGMGKSLFVDKLIYDNYHNNANSWFIYIDNNLIDSSNSFLKLLNNSMMKYTRFKDVSIDFNFLNDNKNKDKDYDINIIIKNFSKIWNSSREKLIKIINEFNITNYHKINYIITTSSINDIGKLNIEFKSYKLDYLSDDEISVLYDKIKNNNNIRNDDKNKFMKEISGLDIKVKGNISYVIKLIIDYLISGNIIKNEIDLIDDYIDYLIKGLMISKQNLSGKYNIELIENENELKNVISSLAFISYVNINFRAKAELNSILKDNLKAEIYYNYLTDRNIIINDKYIEHASYFFSQYFIDKYIDSSNLNIIDDNKKEALKLIESFKNDNKKNKAMYYLILKLDKLITNQGVLFDENKSNSYISFINEVVKALNADVINSVKKSYNQIVNKEYIIIN